MSTVSPIAMALMPLSQAVAWYLVLQTAPPRSSSSSISSTMTAAHMLYAAVFKIALFYMAWALWKRFIEQAQELGYLSMGFLAVAAYMQHRTLSLIGTALVLINFLLPAYFVLSWSPSKLAKIVKKTDSSIAIAWAYIFKLYFLSCIVFWSVVAHKFWKLSPTAVSAEYETVDATIR